jgi:hypothetical protein
VAQQLANLGVVADGFGNDVARPLKRILQARDAFSRAIMALVRRLGL